MNAKNDTVTKKNAIDLKAAHAWLEEVVTKKAVEAEAAQLGLKGADLPMVLRASGIRSQGELSVLAINMTEGQITSEKLTELLSVSFPEAGVGQRHGPHYLCLARTGKLAGSRFAIPKAVRKASGPKNPAEKVAWLESRLSKAREELKAETKTEVKGNGKSAKA